MWREDGRSYTGRSEKVFNLGNGGSNPATSVLQMVNKGDCPFYAAFQMRNFVTDIGTEELAHLEMVATIVHQLTKNLSMDEIENSGFATYYLDHTVGIWPQAASGQQHLFVSI